MHGVGPGTVLGGRYAATRRISDSHGAERWAAHDDHLVRDVTLLCFPTAHPQAAAVLDAARRAAAVDNPQLARILDVGRDGQVAYVVEEDLSQAPTLASLAAHGGLPAEEARRVVGEAAMGLEAARLRGLHHEAITPESVVRTGEGAVKVLGLATAAALVGQDDVPPDQASRKDALGVVALTYAGLTGRWPLTTDAGGLPPAPRLAGGGVASPSEIAVGVPSDLDALCRLTFNDDQGPTTPGDFARQVAPWSTSPIDDLGAGGTAPRDDETARMGTPARAGAVGGATAGPAAPAASGQTDDAPAADEAPGDATPGAGAVVAAAVSSALGSAGQAVGAAGGRVGGKVNDLARAASARAAERKAARAAAAQWTEEHRVALDETMVVERVAVEEPPAPLLPAETGTPLTRDESKLALGIVAGLLILALVVGLWGVSRIGSHTDLGLGGSTPATSTTGPRPTGSATTTAPSGTAPPAALTDLTIADATAYDPPPGDQKENDAAVGRIHDGDPDSAWSSEGYQSAAFGGLKKGLGLVVDLGSKQTVRQVTLDLPNTSDLTLYAASAATREGATPVGTVTGQKGTVTVDLPDGTSTRYLVIWFTKIGQAPDGRHRAALAEVTVKG